MPEIEAETTERDLVEQVEELLAKATPGRWWFDGYCYIFAKQPDGNCYPMIADFDSDEAYLTRMRGVGAGLVENGQQEANAKLIAAAPELLRRMVERDKRNRQALKLMVDLWDAEHPDDPCGCVGASDDCKYPPTCELCVARMVMEGRDPSAE